MAGGDALTGPRFGRLVDGPSPDAGAETISELLAAQDVRIERIASRSVRDGDWYDQDSSEFVLLVAGSARLGFADGTARDLAPGDWAILPARCRHRVLWTDPDRETIWLAIHLPAG